MATAAGSGSAGAAAWRARGAGVQRALTTYGLLRTVAGFRGPGTEREAVLAAAFPDAAAVSDGR